MARYVVLVIGNLLAGLGFFLLGRLGYTMATVVGGPSPVWPASGLAIGIVYLWGRQYLSGLALGILAYNFSIGRGYGVEFLNSVGNIMAPLIGAWLMQRIASWKFKSRIHVFAIQVAIGSLAACTISAMFGGVSLWTGQVVTLEQLPTAYWTWWVGDFLGNLVILPLMVVLADRNNHWSWKDVRPAIPWLAMAAACSYFILWESHANAFLLAVFPLLILGMSRLGRLWVGLTMLAIAIVALWATVNNQGPFILGTFNNKLLEVQIFLAAMAFTSLLCADYRFFAERRMADLVFLIGAIATSLVILTIQTMADQRDQRRFERLVTESEASIQNRFATYEGALWGARSIFAMKEQVDRKDWQEYVNALNLSERYPGILGVGVIFPVSRQDSAAFEERQRASGLPDFRIKTVPQSTEQSSGFQQSEQYVITYIEPLSINLQAVGLDIGSEINRRAAAIQARDTGRSTLTRPITLVQDRKQRPGVLIFLPIQRSHFVAADGLDPTAPFKGWVYAPVLTENFLNDVLGRAGREINLRVSMRSVKEQDQVIYTSLPADDEQQGYRAELRTIQELGQQKIYLDWQRSEGFVSARGNAASWVLLAGVLISLLLATLVGNLQSINVHADTQVEAKTRELRAREKELAEKNEAMRLALKQAEEGTRAKSAFIANMSHELRTPLNAILGMGQILQETRLDREQKQLVNTVVTAGEGLLALINDVLDISKIEAGQLTLEKQPIDLPHLVQQTLDILAVRGLQKGLRFIIHFEPDLPTAWEGDPTRIRQLLMNIVGNAVKFTERGEIDVRVARNHLANHPGNLMISVRDTGAGIPAEKIPRLFERFYQVDGSTTRKYGGTGLGLNICKTIVKMMGGDIWVESEVGQGSCFYMTLNLPEYGGTLFRWGGNKAPLYTRIKTLTQDEATKFVQSKPKAPDTKVASLTRTWRVLLVDDNEDNRALISVMLRSLPLEFVEALHGEEAFHKFQSEGPFDLVFMDMQMPVMDGFVATRAIRKWEQEHGHPPVPIIAVTAYAMVEDQRQCLDVGCNLHLSKPIQKKHLLKVLGELMPQIPHQQSQREPPNGDQKVEPVA